MTIFEGVVKNRGVRWKAFGEYAACLWLSIVTPVLGGLSPEQPIPTGALGYRPNNGTTVTVTPPYFTWPPVAKAHSYGLEVRRQDDPNSALVCAHTKHCIFVPEMILPPGNYEWRFRAVFDEQGTSVSDWSLSRQFVISSSAAAFPRPPLTKFLAAIPQNHPRLLVKRGDMTLLRRHAREHPEWLTALQQEAERLLQEPLMEEPRPWSGGKWNAGEWLNYYRQIVRAAHATETLAFAWLVTGEARYAESARKWLMRFSQWDPEGTTSLQVNDEQAMHIMFSAARAYTWLYDQLTPVERERIRDMLAKRADAAYRHLAQSPQPFEQFPYDSHSGRLWHFLGEVALVLYGDIPQAPDWLDYCLSIYYGWFPIWGAEDGGWAEGLHYFCTYQEYVIPWIWTLEKVLHVRALKPFYRRAGDFLLAVAPPGAAVSGFGDFSENPPTSRRAWVAAALAALAQNSQWEWFAQQVGLGRGDISPMRYLIATAQHPKAMPPGSSPRLRVLNSTGLMAYHSNIAQAAQNVSWLLRAAPLGNLSHSHCDQLAIVVGAYGDPLFVNTGYRDYYGSPFCRDWYWHTRSHNSVLIANQGQGRGAGTGARLLAWREDNEGAWAWADATQAYGALAKRVHRAVAYMTDEQLHLLIVLDDIETTAENVSVLWHTRVEPTLRESAGVFDVQTTAARVRACVLSPQNIEAKSSDRYDVPIPPQIDPLAPPRPQEYHLTFRLSHSPESEEFGRYQCVTFIQISPRSVANVRFPSHLRILKWGTEVALQWQIWKDQSRPLYYALVYDTSRVNVRFYTGSQAQQLRPEKPLEASEKCGATCGSLLASRLRNDGAIDPRE